MASIGSALRSDPVREVMRRAMSVPLLERQREAELARRWLDRADEDARDELVSSHMRLVVSMATKFRGYGLPLGDLIQEGVIGLMEAVSRFEPERGFRLATYAMWWIRAAMQDYILRNRSIVRLGSNAVEKSLFFNLRRLRAQVAKEPGGDMAPAERAAVAEALDVPIEAVERMEGVLGGSDQSINVPLGDDNEVERQDLLPDEGPTPEDVVVEMHDNAARSRWLADALRHLPAREEMIIRERHLKDQVVTLEDLGRQLGISKERVRQLERRALGRLKDLATMPAGAGQA